MREMLSALKPKEKLAIALSMSGFALILAAILMAFSFCSASRHEHKYDYHLELIDGKFNLVGYCGIADCPSPECVTKDIKGVSLVSAESPTCAKEGKRVYAYRKGNVNLQYVEKIPTTHHRYKVDGVNVNGSTLTLECTQSGCPSPSLTLENVTEFKLSQYIEGDCFITRQAIYSYVADGKAGNFVTLLNESRPHTLAGKSADKVQISEGLFAYGQAGVKLFDTSASLGCGSVSNGFYICEKCAQVVVVKVKKPNHNLVYSASDVVEPTVLEAGSVNTHCSNEGCSYTQTIPLPTIVIGENSTVIAQATEENPLTVAYSYTLYGCKVELVIEIGTPVVHNYIYELVLVPTGDGFGQFNLVGVCNDAGCEEPNVTIYDVNVTFENTSTCMKGEMKCIHERDGRTYELTMPAVPNDNHDFTYDISQATKPTLDSEGEIVISCNRGCGYANEKVTLPKVELGVNAKVVLDTEAYTLLEYQHVTDKGCVIIIAVVIDK